MSNVFALNVLSGVIKIASAFLTFLMFLFLARALGPEEYGRFSTMFSLGSFLAFGALLGQQTRVLKRLPGWVDSANFGYVNGLIRQSMLSVLAAGLAVSLILYLVSVLAPWASLAEICLGTIPLVLPFALAHLFASLLRVFGAMVEALIPRDVIWRLVIIVLSSGAGVSVLAGVSARIAMAVISSVLLVLVIVQAIFFVRKIPKEIRNSSHIVPPKRFWADSTWFWMAGLVGIMASNLAVVLTSVSLSNEETGAFFAASKVAQLLQLPLMAANIVAAPLLSRLYSKRDFRGMQEACFPMAVFLSVTSLVGAVSIGALPNYILSLFDPAYSVATPALLVLAVGQLFSTLCGPVGVLMLMGDGERRFLLLTGLSEGLGLVLILVLAPSFGLLGAAYAGLIGKLGWNALAVIWCRKVLDVDPTILGIFRKSE